MGGTQPPATPGTQPGPQGTQPRAAGAQPRVGVSLHLDCKFKLGFDGEFEGTQPCVGVQCGFSVEPTAGAMVAQPPGTQGAAGEGAGTGGVAGRGGGGR